MKKLGKPIKIILFVVILAVIVGGSIMFLKDLFASRHERMVAYRYSCGGGMTGGHKERKIFKVDDEKALVIYSSAEWHYEDPEIAEYYVPLSVLKSMEEVFDKYKMHRYNNLPKSKFFALDADTSSYCLEFEGGKSVSFSSTEMVPKKAYDGIREIEEILSEAVNKTEKLPGLVKEQVNGEEEVFSKVKQGEFQVQVYEYSNNYLRYRLANGLEESKTLKDIVDVYQIVDGERKLLHHEESSYDYEVSGNYCSDESVELSCERLKAGKYVLVVSGYEREFEIK